MNKHLFGSDFKWGVSTAAYQIEGACNVDGKGASIWDEFCTLKGKIAGSQSGSVACEFYNRYLDDLLIMKSLNIPNFRFSISWPRLLPDGTGKINQKGVDFYNTLIDKCIELGIEPWVTLYHWDLPAVLERKGGWVNRDIVGWFSEYTSLCAKLFGDRVKYWMVLNEPMVFVGAGYFLGIHAPGKRGFGNFLPATHHAALCQAEGGRILKGLLPHAEVGTTFSCSYVQPYRNNKLDKSAAHRVDAVLNRMFLEPSLGLGYPVNDFKPLRKIEKYMKDGDDKMLEFGFDFIGVQNYTREMVKHSFFTPFIWAKLIKASKRNVPDTLMGWEVYPESIYQMLKKFDKYKGIKKLIVTENGASFSDVLKDGQVHDHERVTFLKDYLAQVLKAKNEGVNVEGYFIWTFTDNFEWAEGYKPRFGLVYVDFENQQRIVKDSGIWYRGFLKE